MQTVLIYMEVRMKYATVQGQEQISATHLTSYYEANYKLGWCYMDAFPRPCFSQVLLDEIDQWYAYVKRRNEEGAEQEFKYLVLASNIPGIFNLGGDLNLFKQLIEEGDYNTLFDYAKSCIDVLFQNISHLNEKLTTISLVQGDALGGGFEAALSCNVLIAEKGTKMGLPEVLFNLFPGMGAFSLLSQKIGVVKTKKMIFSGQRYSAEELYDMGVVDILAEKGEGKQAVYSYIKRAERAANSYSAMREVQDMTTQITYQELMEITRIWVEAALRLRKRDLRMMEHLVSRQTAKQKNKKTMGPDSIDF